MATAFLIMDAFRLMFLIEGQHVHRVDFAVYGEYTHDSIGAVVRLLADGIRACMHVSLSVNYCLVWRVGVPLGPYSDLQLWHRPTAPQNQSGELAGAKQTAPFNEFCCLRGGFDTLGPFDVRKLIPGAIGPRDMLPGSDGKIITLYSGAPILASSTAYINACCKLIEGLETAVIKDSGEVFYRPLSEPDFKLHYGTYEMVRHDRAVRMSAAGRFMQQRLIVAVRRAVSAANGLSAAMEAFPLNWGDGATPEGLHGQNFIPMAITAGAIYNDIAEACGIEVEPRLSGFAVSVERQQQYSAVTDANGLPIWIDDTLVRTQTQVPPEPFGLVPGYVPMVSSCLAALALHVDTLWTFLLASHSIKDNPNGHKRATLDGMKPLVSHWITRYFDEQERPQFRQYYGPFPPQDGHEWLLFTSGCELQNQFEADYFSHEGTNFARHYFDHFQAVSHAVHGIKNVLALLLLYFMPSSSNSTIRHGRKPTKHRESVRGFAFTPAEGTPEDARLIGNACDFVTTRSYKRGAFTRYVYPCFTAPVPYRTPSNPAPINGPIWNSTIDEPPPSLFDYAAAYWLGDHRFTVSKYVADRSQWE